MYFIAEDPLYVQVARGLEEMRDPRTGDLVREAQRHVFAKFVRSEAPEWAVTEARKVWQFRKKPENLTEQQWMGWYDSVEDASKWGWTKEQRAKIEQRLSDVEGVIKVERPRLAPPWPAYDKLTAVGKRTIDQIVAKITEKVREDGYAPQDVIAYEKENLNRAPVIEALEAMLETHVPDEELIEA